jgi:hypothetical protein
MQMNLVTECVFRMSVADGPDRLNILATIQPCFAALRWLQAEQFADQPLLLEIIADVEREAEGLARLGEGEVNWTAGMSPRARCPVCGQKLVSGGGRVGLHCQVCSAGVMTALGRLGSGFEGFGTEGL